MRKESICPICKKIFIPAPYHIYVKDQITYCGWNCYNKVINKKVSIQRKTKSVVMKNENGKILKVFENAKEASKITGFLEGGIRDSCREKRMYMKHYWEYV